MNCFVPGTPDQYQNTAFMDVAAILKRKLHDQCDTFHVPVHGYFRFCHFSHLEYYEDKLMGADYAVTLIAEATPNAGLRFDGGRIKSSWARTGSKVIVNITYACDIAAESGYLASVLENESEYFVIFNTPDVCGLDGARPEVYSIKCYPEPAGARPGHVE
jgi:hypothetical protein